jgi:cytochrome P450
VEDVPQLPYTRMVLDEALRLYPPVAMFPRDVVADDTIGGYYVPAKSMVFVGPYMTHRHPEFWEKPLEFYPEHFTPERVERRPRYAYYPFSAGPRTCIGNHFALLEATLVLAELAQRARLRLAPGQTVTPEFVGTLRPPGAKLWMTVERR